ncbi:MAG: hypothetical protein GX770_04840 [Firmicutes bacterium]|nr:hypothetical protein [Bacillota bacterium]
MLRKNRVLFSLLIVLVISTFMLSGCGGGKGGSGVGSGGGDPSALNKFIGTWVSQDLDPQIILTIDSMIGDITEGLAGGYYVFYTGSVQCDELIETVVLTEEHTSHYGDYIAGNYVTDGEFGELIYIVVSADSVSFTGTLINSSTMRAGDLDKELFNYSGEYVTFNKQ